MTAKTIKRAISQLPDNAEVEVAWKSGFQPTDSDPAVAITGFHAVKNEDGKPVLRIEVGIEYLNEG